MKKVLIVLQGSHFPNSAFDFVQRLNEQMPLKVTGLLLPEIVPIKNWAAYSLASVGNLKDPAVNVNRKMFEEKCNAHHIAHRLHHGTTDLGLPQVVSETNFADLLIASDTAFFTEGNETSGASLLHAMHSVHCPVLAIPEKFDYPEQIMLAYDGSAAAMYAIKQFAYLLPQMCKLPTTVVYENDFLDPKIPGQEYATEWINEYFPDNRFISIDHDVVSFFSSKAKNHPLLVVAGSFGRSGFSQWLQPSFSAHLLAQHNLILFTAHKD